MHRFACQVVPVLVRECPANFALKHLDEWATGDANRAWLEPGYWNDHDQKGATSR
jgi:hypothetical protein